MTVEHAHSSKHNEHYTPAWLADAGRYVLGGFTLDPFSCPKANETIKADRHWGIDDWTDGHTVWNVPWYAPRDCGSRVWCNPPGGRIDADTLAPLPRNERGRQGGPGLSSAGAGFAKISHEWSQGHVDCALFLCFSLNVFRTAQSAAWARHFPKACAPTSFPFVVFRDRIHFDTIDEDTGEVVNGAGDGAPQDSALVLLPSRTLRMGHETSDLERFDCTFSKYGHVRL